MPEGPELYLASQLINSVCKGRLFSGSVVKSAVSTRNPEIEWNAEFYQISATSRGKEIKLTLTQELCKAASQRKLKDCDGKKSSKVTPNNTLDIVFRFGMSGKFTFSSIDELHKHAHLNFYTIKEKALPHMVLSFVDQRRFGRWEPGGSWGAERGPCVLLEYNLFRDNVLKHMEGTAFNRPICEVLLNQKYFNGIGNYLRAEILHRAGVAPFVEARSVLQGLSASSDGVKSEACDILQLCNTLPMEVISLGGTAGYDPEASESSKQEFMKWLQCYYNPAMKAMPDHNKRTIWFSGSTGPLAPKGKPDRAKKRQKADKTSNANTKKTKTPKKVAKSKGVKTDEEESVNSSLESKPATPNLSKRITRRSLRSSKPPDVKQDPVVRHTSSSSQRRRAKPK